MTPATSTGVLLDAEVQGVSYSTSPSGKSGVTNAAGEYQYVEGDTVTFSVGSVVLGTAPATGVMTPASLAAAATLTGGVTAKDVALNIAIFLQSFDADGNPDNGITIAPAVATAATAALNFVQTSTNFAADSTLATLAGNASDDDVTYAVVAPADAEAHLVASLRRTLEGSWLIDSSTEPGSSMAVLTIFPDGKYVLGIDHVDPNCADGVEYGSYELDAARMRLRVTGVTVDNTGPAGECGLFEDGEGANLTVKLHSATRFSFPDPDGENPPIVLNKIANNGTRGSWTEWGTEGGVKAVLTLLGNGTYMVAQVEEEHEPLGVEVGNYTFTNGDKLRVTSVVTDTNGNAGLNELLNCTTDCVGLGVDSFGWLVVEGGEEGDLGMTPQPYRLTVAGNSASSRGALMSPGCGSPAGWDYSFTTSSMTWTGSDTWIDCEVADDETLDFDELFGGYPGSNFDAPFAGCLGGVCSWQELNKTLSGLDEDDRPYTSTYVHAPGSDTIVYTKTITGGDDEGDTWTETITLTAAVE